MENELVIFDFSGTLAFTKKPDREKFFNGLADFGIKFKSPSEIKAFQAIFPQFFSSAQSWQDFAEKIIFATIKKTGEEEAKKLALFLRQMMAFELYEDTEEIFTLETPKAVLTVGSHFLVDDVSLPEDIDIFTPAETEYVKPDSRAFLAVLEKLNVSPEAATMVGDEIESNLIPARDLGMTAILIDRENKVTDLPEGIIKIDSLRRLKSHIQ